MPQDEHARGIIRFSAFALDRSSGELYKGPTRLKAPHQSIEILIALLERPGEVVGREDLRRRLWPGHTFVDFEQGLNAAMRRLRHALGDSADTPRFIETLPRRGYRFIGSCDPSTGPQHRRSAAGSIRDAVGRPSGGISMASRDGKRVGRERVTHDRSSQIRSLVVLPFANASGAGTQQYFADGMTESLIGSMSVIGRLRVISVSSAARYRSTDKSLPQIARELAVDGLIQGVAVQSENGFRVDVALVDGQSGDALWSRRYERPMTDLLRVQAEIAETVAAEIRLKLSANERRRFRGAHARSAQAQEAYLRGRYHWNRETSEGLQKSFEYLSEALQQEPTDAACHAAMADWYLSAAINSLIPMAEGIQRAKVEALRSLELDDRLAEAYACLGRIAIIEWDLQRARAECEMAMRRNPNLAEPVILSARTLSYLSLHEEAIERVKYAKRLDPVSPRTYMAAAVVYYIAGDFARAVEESRQALELEPRHASAFYFMGLSQLRLGRAADALESLETAVAVGQRHPAALAGLAFVLAQTGHPDDAVQVLEEMRERATRAQVSPYYFAEVFVALHDVEKALEYLSRSYELHIPDMIGISVDPLFESLHGHPAFELILSRLRVQST
jgi:TolB-like protein/DNA-binding winged helix-turn-helix (wHTH) protein